MAKISDNDNVTLAALKAALCIFPIDSDCMDKCRATLIKNNPKGQKSNNLKMLAFARHRFTNYDELCNCANFEKDKMWGRWRRHVKMTIEPFIMTWLNPSNKIKTNNATREKYAYQYNAFVLQENKDG